MNLMKVLFTQILSSAGLKNLNHGMLLVRASLCLKRKQENAFSIFYFFVHIILTLTSSKICGIPVVKRFGRNGLLLTLINYEFLMTLNYGIVFLSSIFIRLFAVLVVVSFNWLNIHIFPFIYCFCLHF